MVVFMRFFIFLLACTGLYGDLPVVWWQSPRFVNFGDHLSLKIVERMVGESVRHASTSKTIKEKRLLAVGSILLFAKEGDVLWGTGMNAKRMDLKFYPFKNLDVRAIRGPKTAEFLWKNFKIKTPKIYGDPALLMPFLFPEFKRKKNPSIPVLIIPHFSDKNLFPKELFPNVAYATDPWKEIVKRILDSEFVISTSLHGLIVAEAFGVPARYLRVSDGEPMFKFEDYYLGSGREDFKVAFTLEEALEMGGESSFKCDLKALYDAFPFDFWPNAKRRKLCFD